MEVVAGDGEHFLPQPPKKIYASHPWVDKVKSNLASIRYNDVTRRYKNVDMRFLVPNIFGQHTDPTNRNWE